MATELMKYSVENGKKISECKLYMSDSTLAEFEKQKSDISVVNKDNINKKYSKSGYIMPFEGIPVLVDNDMDFGEIRIE